VHIVGYIYDFLHCAVWKSVHSFNRHCLHHLPLPWLLMISCEGFATASPHRAISRWNIEVVVPICLFSANVISGHTSIEPRPGRTWALWCFSWFPTDPPANYLDGSSTWRQVLHLKSIRFISSYERRHAVSTNDIVVKYFPVHPHTRKTHGCELRYQRAFMEPYLQSHMFSWLDAYAWGMIIFWLSY
jgi:hypothetical protein